MNFTTLYSEDAMDIKYAQYEDFGALGDGIHDDLEAIVACHAYANEHGLDVRAKEGATYYIGPKAMAATVRTNTCWHGAKFIIDDRTVENRSSLIFQIASDSERFTPEITSLERNQKKIDFPHTGKVLVRVFNDNLRIYRRKGLNQDNGQAAADSFIVDGEGNILTDINWDYPTVSNAYAISAEDAPITVEGGEFTTIANAAPCFYTYYRRGIEVLRSNVTIKGLTHLVTGEGECGAPYNGFISVGECCNFTIEDCVLTPHKTYQTPSKQPGKTVSMGTYDFILSGTVGVTMRGITQTVDITDTSRWGLVGTNYSKNVLIENCVMSRYDAHCGVTNALIRGCTLGHQGCNVIGFGSFTIENTTVKSYSFINLRDDYGSFFKGKLAVRNCTWEPIGAHSFVFNGLNTGDHDFGYECTMPYEVTVDGLTIVDGAPDRNGKFYLFPTYDRDFEEGKPFAYKVTETVSLRNVSVDTGRELELTERTELYLDTQIVCP